MHQRTTSACTNVVWYQMQLNVLNDNKHSSDQLIIIIKCLHSSS